MPSVADVGPSGARRRPRPRRSPRPSAPTVPPPRSAASASMLASSGRDSRARACPWDSTPAATRRCTAGGSRSSRIVFEICGRERPDPHGQLLLGAPEVRQQLLVGGRLLERIERRAVQVLQQRVAQQVGVLRGTDHDRDRVPPQALGAAESALSGDQLVLPPSSDPGRSPVRTTRGWRSPISAMDAASSSRASSSNTVRGWRGLGRIDVRGSSAYWIGDAVGFSVARSRSGDPARRTGRAAPQPSCAHRAYPRAVMSVTPPPHQLRSPA